MTKTKVAFVCTHNSCRSQMAEAIAKQIASDVFECYSAGTEIKGQINPVAVKVLKELYDVDILQNQKPKLLKEIPEVDIVITMGCNVNCPILPCKQREDWGLDDPTGKNYAEFINTANIIKAKILQLKNGVNNSKNLTLQD